ncbi:hypothetical protein LCGC14_2799090, partial [marine sediment metagenome]
MTTLAFALLLTASLAGYAWNRQAAQAIRKDGGRLHSLSGYHGLYSVLTVLVPIVVVILLWLLLQGAVIDWLVMGGLQDRIATLAEGERQLVLTEIKSIAGGRVFGTPEDWKLAAAARLSGLRDASGIALLVVVGLAALVLILLARRRVSADFRARQGVERIVSGLMIFCSVVAIFTTVGIIAALIFETAKFLEKVPLTEFLFGLNWEPQIPIREGQVAAEGAFGWIPVILGTIVISAVAMFIAIPVGLLSAIYLNEFAPRAFRAVAKPVLEILAGVPTVVYGFFAILVVAPAIRSFGAMLGIPVAPNTALAAGSVMGVMLIPFISSFADDALSAVPRSLRDGALALGATRAETMLN